MRRLLVASVLLLSIFICSHAMGQSGTTKAGLRISSQAFGNGGEIPKKFTCDGTNVSPPLRIEGVPSNTRSLALVFDDIDAPRGSYVHWILWNIGPTVTEIKENSVPEGAVQGMNDFKKSFYGGPCPPRRAHKYVFIIYALDRVLDLSSRSTKKDLEQAMEGHIVSWAQLTGVYKRK